MRILRWSGLENAIIRVPTRTGVVVAIPCDLPQQDVLCLASAILSACEYEELLGELAPAGAQQPRGPSTT